jgi:hypothetical protein
MANTGDIDAFNAQFAAVYAIVAIIPVPLAAVNPASAIASAKVEPVFILEIISSA